MRTAASILALAALAGWAAPVTAQGNPDVTGQPEQGVGWTLYPPLPSETPEGQCRVYAHTAASTAMNMLQEFDATVTIELKGAGASCKLTMADAARTVDFEGQPD